MSMVSMNVVKILKAEYITGMELFLHNMAVLHKPQKSRNLHCDKKKYLFGSVSLEVKHYGIGINMESETKLPSFR